MVADALQPGIFDVAIARAGYPYLEAEPADPVDIKLQQALAAGDVMSSQVGASAFRKARGNWARHCACL